MNGNATYLPRKEQEPTGTIRQQNQIPVLVSKHQQKEKFATGVADDSGAPSLANISTNFNFRNNSIRLFSWAWGKMIHEKNLKQKIS